MTLKYALLLFSLLILGVHWLHRNDAILDDFQCELLEVDETDEGEEEPDEHALSDMPTPAMTAPTHDARELWGEEEGQESSRALSSESDPPEPAAEDEEPSKGQEGSFSSHAEKESEDGTHGTPWWLPSRWLGTPKALEAVGPPPPPEDPAGPAEPATVVKSVNRRRVRCQYRVKESCLARDLRPAIWFTAEYIQECLDGVLLSPRNTWQAHRSPPVATQALCSWRSPWSLGSPCP